MDTFMTAIQTFFALAIVCGLVYLIFRVILPRLSFNYSSNNMIRVVDRVAIDSRKSLCVVEVAGQWMLVAVTEKGVEKICDLDKDSAKVLEKEVKRSREKRNSAVMGAGLVAKVTDMMSKKSGGK